MQLWLYHSYYIVCIWCLSVVKLVINYHIVKCIFCWHGVIYDYTYLLIAFSLFSWLEVQYHQ